MCVIAVFLRTKCSHKPKGASNGGNTYTGDKHQRCCFYRNPNTRVKVGDMVNLVCRYGNTCISETPLKEIKYVI